jgi:hypothetical protein
MKTGAANDTVKAAILTRQPFFHAVYDSRSERVTCRCVSQNQPQVVRAKDGHLQHGAMRLVGCREAFLIGRVFVKHCVLQSEDRTGLAGLGRKA